MKKNLLTMAVILSLSIFSTTTFAQDDSGGYSGGEGGSNPPDEGGTVTVPPQPTAVHFTRNNGDGTCGGLAQIRMYYTVAPTVQPELTQIYYQEAPLYSNFTPVKGNIAGF